MKDIQHQMFSDIKDKTLFHKAESMGLDYLDQVFERNIFPTEEALNHLKKFDEPLADAPCTAHEVLDLLDHYGGPATVALIGGRYFGFVNGGVTPAGLAAKNLSNYWDQNTALQVMSPVASKLESVVQQWLVDLFGFKAHTVAGFVSGTSMANFCGLSAARYRLLQNQGWDVSSQGLRDAPGIRIITSKEAHSTIFKAIALLGLGSNNIELVEVDDQGRIRTELIPHLDSTCILILQAGNVNSGAFDDFEALCERARNHGTWVHIDGAFGLWAGATQTLSHLTQGFTHAHSWAVDGHKTLNTPYDSGIVMSEDPTALMSALHMSGDYIIQSDERDGMYYTPEMSRRSRIIELWATMKYLGKDGIDQMITGLHRRAVQFATLIDQVEGFSVLNEVVFNQVIVQCASDTLTDKVILKIQQLRECWVGGSIWQGKKIIRVSICSWATTKKDIVRSVESFKKAYALVQK